MNERIRQLVKQAGGHFSTHNLMSNPVQHRESIELWDKNIEKFAELIVDECITQIQDHMGRGKRDEYYQGQSDSVKFIRQHFGVKE